MPSPVGLRAARRLRKDLKLFIGGTFSSPQDEAAAQQLRRNFISKFDLYIIEDNVFNVRAELYGPPETPFYKGRFEFTITPSQSYPFEAPKVICTTPIFHPNTEADEFIAHNWTASMALCDLMAEIYGYFRTPSTSAENIQDKQAANLYTRNQFAYFRNCRYSTYAFALTTVQQLPQLIYRYLTYESFVQSVMVRVRMATKPQAARALALNNWLVHLAVPALSAALE